MKLTPHHIGYGLLSILFFGALLKGCIAQNQHNKTLQELETKLNVATAEAHDAEHVYAENMSLRKYIRTHEEPIILTKPEYIVKTQVVVKEVETTVTLEQIPDDFEYDFIWDSGLIAGRYTYNGQHSFVTPSISFDVRTELDADQAVVQVFADSSLNAEPILLVSSTDVIRLDPIRSRCVWCWFAAGTVVGLGTTAGAVKLAGELR